MHASLQLFKRKFRNLAIQEGKRRKAVASANRRKLEAQLQVLTTFEEADPEVWLKQIKTYKGEMAHLLLKRYKGAMIRWREQVLASGEVPTRLFLTMERDRNAKTNIMRLRRGGLLLESQCHIKEAFVEECIALLSNPTPITDPNLTILRPGLLKRSEGST